MSLTITHPFTISTYDPPSTPIALAVQQTAAGQSQGGDHPFIRSSDNASSGSNNVWGNLKRTEATPPVRSKSECFEDDYSAVLILVLPWVKDIVTEGYVPPEGMFGPYDSSTSFQTHSTAIRQLTSRTTHKVPITARKGSCRRTQHSSFFLQRTATRTAFCNGERGQYGERHGRRHCESTKTGERHAEPRSRTKTIFSTG
jgi:hypothetical protein